MKSMQRSWGKYCPKLTLSLLVTASAGLVSCQTPTSAPKSSLAVKSNSETSLASDQKTIEQLRKNIPEEKRAENDQLREILSMTGEVKDHPSRIREKFSRETMRMRELHRREMQKQREQFNREEKKARDDFYSKLKNDRDRMKNKKLSRDDQKLFYDQQEQSRREFSADERDKRNRFNSDLKVKDDDFNSMMRDKNNEFSAQMREYSLKYDEFIKQKNQKQRRTITPETSSAPAPTPLKTGDDEP